MLRTMLKSKIHRATVTQADLHYVGSVTVDQDLLDAADLLPGEQVAIVDITNGARLETYVIPGERGSGVIGINGAAAHLVHPGDLVILISYGQMDDAEARAVPAPGGARRRRQPGHRAGRRPGRRRPRARPATRSAASPLTRLAGLTRAVTRRLPDIDAVRRSVTGRSFLVTLARAVDRRRSSAGGGRDAPCDDAPGRRAGRGRPLLAGCAATGGLDGDLTDDWAALAGARRVHPGRPGSASWPTSPARSPSAAYEPVGCDLPHRVETVHVGRVPGGRARGSAGRRLGGAAGRLRRLRHRASAYVGDDWRAGRLRLGVALPSAPGWAAGARWYRCDLTELSTVEARAEVVSRDGQPAGRAEGRRPPLRLGCQRDRDRGTAGVCSTLTPVGCGDQRTTRSSSGSGRRRTGPYPTQGRRLGAVLHRLPARSLARYAGVPDDATCASVPAWWSARPAPAAGASATGVSAATCGSATDGDRLARRGRAGRPAGPDEVAETTRPAPAARDEGRRVDCAHGPSDRRPAGRCPALLAAPAPGWVETTDVIVVGSGVAGLTAALHLREAGLHVTVVTKVNIDDGSTRWAQGGIAAVLDPAGHPGGARRTTPRSPASGCATRRRCGCWSRRGRPGCGS